jgi:ribosomal-protein-alanine N-acetyltransferase
LLGLAVDLCRTHAVGHLWLEVRESNHRAQLIYSQFGFQAKGLRKGYYPAPHGQREHAVVMSLTIPPPPVTESHALG